MHRRVTAKDYFSYKIILAIKNNDLQGTDKIAEEHNSNNKGIRDFLLSRGIVPEDLPAAEDAKKVKRRLESEKKKMLKGKNK